MKKERPMGSEEERHIEEMLAAAGVPEEYRTFARDIAGFSPSERSERIQEMSGINPDFAHAAANIDAYFADYDAENPRPELEEKPRESKPAPAAERPAEMKKTERISEPAENKEEEETYTWEQELAIEVCAAAGIENIDQKTMQETFRVLLDDQRSSGRSPAAIIGDWIEDPEMAARFAAQWEEKYNKGASSEKKVEENPEGAGEPSKPESSEKISEKTLDIGEREKFISEARNEFKARALKKSDDSSPVNALDIIDEVRNMPVGDAVLRVAEAQKRDHRISKYQAALILHAIIPDRVPRPDISDIKFHEPGYVPKNAVGENSVEQVANEEERPVPGFPEGYVRRAKKAPERGVGAVDDSLGRWEDEGGQVAAPIEKSAEADAKEKHLAEVVTPAPEEGRTAGSARESRESAKEEKEMSPERKALDQRLRDGMSLHRDLYRDIHGDQDARDKILDGGLDEVKNFLERLDVFTKVLVHEMRPYLMGKYDLIATVTEETGLRGKNINVNVDDFVSKDFSAIRQLAEKIIKELKGDAGAATPDALKEVLRETPLKESHAEIKKEINLASDMESREEKGDVTRGKKQNEGDIEAPKSKEFEGYRGPPKWPPQGVLPEARPGIWERIASTASQLFNKNMGTIEKYSEQKKNTEEKERKDAGLPERTEERKGPTLMEILKNHEQSRLFGAYLEEQGEDDLAKKLAAGDLDEANLNQLSGRRKEFLGVLDVTKNLSEKLNIKNIEEVVSSSPELKKIADLVGNDGIHDALTRRLSEMAIRDSERIRKIGDRLAQIETTKKEIAEENKKIAEICKKYGISEDQYLAAISGGDSHALDDIVKSKMGRWSKFKLRMGNTGARKKLHTEAESIKKSTEIEAFINRLDADLKDLGASLQSTLIDNEAAHSVLVGQLRQEKPEQSSPDMSFSEMNNARKGDVLKKDFEEFKKNNRAHYTPKGGVFDETAAMQDFARGYSRNVAKKKSGFWAKMFGLLLSPGIIEDLLKG